MPASDHSILQSEEYRKYGMLLDAESLKLFGDPKLKVTSVVNRGYVVSKLNDGVFHELLMRYEKEGGERLWEGADMYAVFLGVYSMESGVTIAEDDMGVLRSALKRVDLHRKAKDQVEKAFTHYKNNGDGWNFRNSPTNLDYNSHPNSGIPAHKMEKEDQYLQTFLKQQNAYLEEEAAKKKGLGNQDGVDDGEDDEDA